MDDLISKQAAIDVVHHTIYEFFDEVEDDDESPLTYKDMKLLELNKSISTRLKDLPSAEPQRYMVSMAESMDIDRLKGIITKPSDITIIPLPKAEPGWIPVTERLPEAEKKRYWICTDTGYQCECRWTNNRFGMGKSDEWGWCIFDVPQYSHVVAWMPLPEPWKGEV